MENSRSLSIQNLVKSYNLRKVVNDVSLEIHQAEIVGLLGPNGAGKTTTFHMITGFIQPEAGRIFIADTDITNFAVYRRARLGIGYLAQEPSIFRKLSVRDNILAILEFLNSPQQERHKIVDSFLAKLDVAHLANHKGSSLSGGERRRVELARALVSNPKFLLLDEPFTGIDPIVRSEIQDIIIGLKNEGLGIFITDHNVRETLEITDRTYIMYDGKVLIHGTPAELINNPLAREHYLGEKFRI
ncbi:MAG: LPS export ABC transporter ATP-binding protein [Candidatus Latescibacteria bacterium]|nr:LPS export ABC transporter ATP-binding protein [Candidatus Latescibacterota bacterium]